MNVEKTLNCTILLWHECSVFWELSTFLIIRECLQCQKQLRKRVWTEKTRAARTESSQVPLLGEDVEKKETSNS